MPFIAKHSHRPDFARGPPPPANPLLSNAAPELYPQPGNPPQGWTYAGFQTIEAGPSGRGANTIWWMGLINSFWWIDRAKGVAGFLAGQVSVPLVVQGFVGTVLIRCSHCQMETQRSFRLGSCARRRFMTT